MPRGRCDLAVRIMAIGAHAFKRNLSSRSEFGATKRFSVTAPHTRMQRRTMDGVRDDLLTFVAWNAKRRPGILPTGVQWENTMGLETHRILLAAIIVIVIVKIKVIVNRR
jgi:hypothetical protein